MSQTTRQQFLPVTPSADDPWLAYDSWGIELACKLITMGYPVDLDGHGWDGVKNWPIDKWGHHAPIFLKALFERALGMANASVKAGTIQEHDTPANWLAWAKGKGYDLAHLESMAAPVVTDAPEAVQLDYSLLATREQLLDAFENWGLKPAWFNDLHGHQWLLDARQKKGQGQRGNIIEPMFCPFAVMNGLIESVRKETRLKPDTAWRVLAHKFPKVYAQYEGCDPRERTGD